MLMGKNQLKMKGEVMFKKIQNWWDKLYWQLKLSVVCILIAVICTTINLTIVLLR